MANRLDRLYDEAMEKAQLAQKAMILRMRTVSGAIPSWFQSHELLEEAYLHDQELLRLRQEASVAWGIVDLRLRQKAVVRKEAVNG